MALSEEDITALNLTLEAAGPQAELIRKLLLEVAELLLAQQFVIDEQTWLVSSDDDAKLMEFLAEVYGEFKHWDEFNILEIPVFDFVRRVNVVAHTTETSRGAASYKAQVVQDQGGEFCVLCGERDSDLHVDHITPVHQGGGHDVVRNMQLLCELCNSGKSDLSDNLLPAILRQRANREIRASSRAKALLMSAKPRGGRTLGTCACGQESAKTQLFVVPRTRLGAANFTMLKVVCEICR